MPACKYKAPKEVGQYRMPVEEQRMAVALVYKLEPIMHLMSKQTRGEFVRISEVLQAFKEGLISENEVIYEFIGLSLSTVKSKDALMALISDDENPLKVNAWWAVLRSWLKVPALNAFILSKEQEDTQALQEAALAAWQALTQAEQSKLETNRAEWFKAKLIEVRTKGIELDMEDFSDEESNAYFDAMLAYQNKLKERQSLKYAGKSEKAAKEDYFKFDINAL
jgi:hypothetical protein